MDIKEAKQEMEKGWRKEIDDLMESSATAIEQIIANAPTPEIRHELATEHLKWLKKLKKKLDII